MQNVLQKATSCEPAAANDSLPAAFERTVRAHGARTAVCSDTWTATFDELNATANRLAHALVAHGCAPGDRVAILMRHDSPQIAAFVGAVKAGAIVVALNPSNPPARLRQLIGDAEPALVVGDQHNSDVAADIAGANSSIVSFEDASVAGPTYNLSMKVDPGQASVLVYTSGSTGVPKGVMQTHRQRLRITEIHTGSMGITAEDRLPLFVPLSHGQSIGTACCALLSGAALLPFPVAQIGVTGLFDWMTRNGITNYISSASIFRNFMKTMDSGARIPLVHAVRLASESATSDDFRLFQQHFSENCVFVHTLSCSETSTIGVLRWSHGDAVPEGRLPVRLIAEGQEVSFLDEQGDPVPRGEVGEIVVKSPYLAAGYWRNPALTVERFSSHGSGGRVFRTGDLCRIDTEGMLHFVGRKGERVKIRGNRIELSEAADGICRVSGVEHAIVDAVERPNHEPLLVGYVVMRDGHATSPTRLRHELRAIQPDHMIPSVLVMLDSLPLTPNGKIDRERLRQLLPKRNIDAVDPPQTMIEALLAKLWSEAFELPDVSRNDDFFDLGGDSLIAAVVAARIHSALGVELTLGMIADHPKLADLAGAIDKLRPAGAEATPPLVRAPGGKPLPLSFWQDRIWTYSQTREQSAGYTVARAQRIAGPLNAEILSECMTYLAGRHEILRTSYELVDGQPAQIVHPPAPVKLAYHDFSGSDNPEAEALSIRMQESSYIFDLTRAPLVRFTLIRLRDNEHWLLRTSHSICGDNWSWEVYFRELAVLYEARLDGRKPPLPQLAALQYGDYAEWQRQVLRRDSQAYKSVVDWWTSMLSGTSAPRLPFMRRQALARVDPAEGTFPWGMAGETVQALDTLGRAEGATAFMVRLAVFVALLADETGQKDVVVGAYVSNRQRAELQDMLGFFANLVTLRFHFEPQLSFRAWLSLVRARMIEIDARSDIPYDELCNELQTAGITPPEIAVMFSTPRNRDALYFGELSVTTLERIMNVASMPWGFRVALDDRHEDRASRVAFDAGIYDPVGVRRFIERFERLLDAVSRHPEKILGDLLMMSRSASTPLAAGQMTFIP
jgi:amino acid adenylation domain-containing protein